ncbi:MAG: SDR family NAD(P)-dependent oxidoreductase [Ilumatobacteraceae bacterium]
MSPTTRPSDTAAATPRDVAIVTGATSGLGRAISIVLAEARTTVAVAGRNAARGADVVATIEAAGGRARFFSCDLGSSAGCDRLVDEVAAALGPVSILVNNAYASDAIADDAPVGAISDDAWDRIIVGNLSSAMWMTRAALRAMVPEGRGSIVNVSARAGVLGTPGMAAHASSKGALNALTRSVAVDYASAGIRCNAVLPGHILHDRRDADLTPERRAMLEAMHLTRLATADDIARAVAFLAGSDAAVMTGVLLPVDGGSSAVRAAVVGGADPRLAEH